MYITINSEFKPFTYDELTKPLQDYTEAYNKVEEQYATLAQQTEAWKNIATQENSPEAYAMYKKYSDELNAVVEDFSRGMTIRNRGQLSGLKSRYASEITPISIAYDAMQKANAYRDTIKGQDDSAIFNVDRYTSLDDFLNGQMADNNFISGKEIQNNVTSQIMAESYNQYNKYIAEGKSEREAAKLAAEGKWVDEASMLNNLYANTGINTEEAAIKAKSYLDNGIAQGIAAFSISTDEALTNKEIEMAKLNEDNITKSNNNSNDFEWDEKDAAVKLYNMIVKDLYVSDLIEEEHTVNEGKLDEYKEKIKTRKPHYYTDDEKYSMILGDPNYKFALSLTEYMKFDDVVDFYTDYTNIGEAGFDGGTHFETGTSFEDYTDLIMLGYTKEDIKKAVKEIEDTGSTNWRDYNMKNYFLNNDN